MRDSEVDYATGAIALNPENESPWRYIRGLYRGHIDLMVKDDRISETCLKILKDSVSQVFALSMVIDLLSHGLEPDEELRKVVEKFGSTIELPAGCSTGLAALVCAILESMDPMRSSYWSWRRSNLSN